MGDHRDTRVGRHRKGWWEVMTGHDSASDRRPTNRRASPTYVCDGCMRHITATEVGIWADHEHVLCHQCRDEGSRHGRG